MNILSKQQLVAVLATANASALDAFVQAVESISSGVVTPEDAIETAMARIAFAVNSGRLGKAVQLFGSSTQLLGDDLEDGFLQLKEAVEGFLSVMPPTGQA
jgi:hypothetical protein